MNYHFKNNNIYVRGGRKQGSLKHIKYLEKLKESQL